MLMLAALLPSVTAEDAEALSGNPDSAAGVRATCTGGTCSSTAAARATATSTTSTACSASSCWRRARARLPDGGAARGARRAPRGMLVARGDIDAAASIYRDAGAWPELAGARARRVDAPGRRRPRTTRCATGSSRCPSRSATASPDLVYALAVTHVYGDPRAREVAARARVRRVRRARRRARRDARRRRVDRLPLPRVGRLRAARPLDRRARARARRTAGAALAHRGAARPREPAARGAVPPACASRPRVACASGGDAARERDDRHRADQRARCRLRRCCSTTTTGRPRASPPTR